MNVLNLLDSVVTEVLSAGELLVAELHRLEGPRGQGDKADVDFEIEERLRTALLGLLDCDFWGEETGSRMLGHDFCWVVDPNDGTRDFLHGTPGSAISVGLLRKRLPVLGVVYAPTTTDRGPDYIYWAEGLSGVMRNGKTVPARLTPRTLQTGSVVLVSTAATGKPAVNSELCAPAEFVPMPSIAYRLARVAVGDAVVGTSLVPVSAHDLVGGHALLIGASATLLDEDGNEVLYDSEEKMKAAAQRCFGGSREACEVLVKRDWERVFQK